MHITSTAGRDSCTGSGFTDGCCMSGDCLSADNSCYCDETCFSSGNCCWDVVVATRCCKDSIDMLDRHISHSVLSLLQMEVLTLAVEVVSLLAAAGREAVFLMMGPASVTRCAMIPVTAVRTSG